MQVEPEEEEVETLIIGAGMSGLGFANAWLEQRKDRAGRVLIVEREGEAGGYCRTVRRKGFVWDYSGHFFHFRHAEIEAWLRARMPADAVLQVKKRCFVRACGTEVDFPFQKNIHQLSPQDFLACLVDLWSAEQQRIFTPVQSGSFKAMLEDRLGRAICERFLIPYNEKLYACDLDSLDADAMGRFFPHTTFDELMRHIRSPHDASYNANFTYPKGGAVEYVRALLRDLPDDAVSLNESLVSVDLLRKTATTTKRKLRYERLVTSVPLPTTLRMCGVSIRPGVFSWNRVLVFNLGFDGKGRDDAHWVYFADRALPFYRVGFYDNIHAAEASSDAGKRMSLYVEVGLPAVGEVDVDKLRAAVLDGLRKERIVTDQRLIAEHHVLMDPAYVHITSQSLEEVARQRRDLENAGVFSIGRYGGWTYCSIEDNLVEARVLAERLARGAR